MLTGFTDGDGDGDGNEDDEDIVVFEIWASVSPKLVIITDR